jgi:hypothetical protein
LFIDKTANLRCQIVLDPEPKMTYMGGNNILLVNRKDFAEKGEKREVLLNTLCRFRQQQVGHRANKNWNSIYSKLQKRERNSILKNIII